MVQFLLHAVVLVFNLILVVDSQDAILYEYTYYGGDRVNVSNLESGKCENFLRFNSRTSSVKTNTTCIRLWANRDCTGRSLDIISPGQENLGRNNFDNLLTSVSNCELPDQGISENVEIVFHLNGATDLEEHSKKIHKLMTDWFPFIQNHLMSPYYKPVRRIDVYYEVVSRGIFAFGNKIFIPQSYIRRRMNETGVFIHEMTHVIQQGGWHCPGWLTEGMAEYMQLWVYQPEVNPLKPTNPKLHDVYLGYWLIAYLDSAVGRPVIYMLIRSCQQGTYSDQLLKDLSGKDVNEWWSIMVNDSSFPWKRVN